MSYWDINQFLAEQEKVQFCMQYDAVGLDFLDATKEGTIPAGQVLTTPIWLVNNLHDYLILGEKSSDVVKVTIPRDFHVKSLDRINSFRSSHRSTVEQVRIKNEMPFFYQIYDAIKKITEEESTKFQASKIAEFLQQRGKLIINRASSIFEQNKADPVTFNYTKFEMDLYRLARNKSIEYEKWKTS